MSQGLSYWVLYTGISPVNLDSCVAMAMAHLPNRLPYEYDFDQ